MVFATIVNETLEEFKIICSTISKDLENFLKNKNSIDDIFYSPYNGLILLNNMHFYNTQYIPEWYVTENIFKEIAKNINAEIISINNNVTELKYNNIKIKLEFIIEYARREYDYYIIGNII